MTELVQIACGKVCPQCTAELSVEAGERHPMGYAYLGLYGDAETGFWHTWAPEGWSAHGGGYPASVKAPKEPATPRKVTEPKEPAKHSCEALDCTICRGEAALPYLYGKLRVPQEVAARHPQPAVDSRTTPPASAGLLWPLAALKLAEEAREWGWEVRQQYARGRTVHATTGRPLAERDSFALVFGGHLLTDAGAYAVYRGKAWDSVCIAGVLIGGVTDLRAWLEAGGQPGTAWWHDLRVRIAEADARKKAATKKVASSNKEGLR